MNGRRNRLPALGSLVSFEAAARHGGFTLAARELEVTPGAVSHQIKSLENRLGLRLFDRTARGVRLTADGDSLYHVLAHSLDAVVDTIDRLQAAQANRAVTVSSTTAMSSLWLTPRLTGFWRTHPNVAVNQYVSDASAPGQPADIYLRYGPTGSGSREREHSFHLFDDTLAPLCSPHFARHHDSCTLDALARLPLIHLDTTHRHWTRWSEWFAAQDHPVQLADGLHVNNHTIALQCARDGVGVVLGWLALAEPLLRRGVLVSIGEHRVPAPHAFHLECDGDATLHPSARLLRDWLLPDPDERDGET